jgi:large subunit ribosomal protein L30
MMAKALQITLVRSLIGRTQDQKDTVKALGLRKIRQTVVKPDNPAIRGMVFKVKHLVDVQEVEA